MFSDVGAEYSVKASPSAAPQHLGFAQKLRTPKAFANSSPGLLQPWDGLGGFAAAIGGGLDIRLSSRIDLRAFQIDYNPMRFDFSDFGTVGIPGTPTPTGDLKRTLHNFRFGIGIVIRN